MRPITNSTHTPIASPSRPQITSTLAHGLVLGAHFQLQGATHVREGLLPVPRPTIGFVAEAETQLPRGEHGAHVDAHVCKVFGGELPADLGALLGPQVDLRKSVKATKWERRG